MPFARHSGYSFTLASVQRNAPASPGVYGLSNASGWILVDSTDDIQAALLDRLNESVAPSDLAGVTGFTFEICGAALRTARHSRLIAELHPSHKRAQD